MAVLGYFILDTIRRLPAAASLKVEREIPLLRKPGFRVLPLSKIKHPRPPTYSLMVFLIVSASGGTEQTAPPIIVLPKMFKSRRSLIDFS